MTYPSIFQRVKAAVIDMIIIILLIITVTDLFAQFSSVSDYARIFAFIFIFIIYEPLFVSVFGASLGHMFTDLRVRRESDETKNIPFHVAIIRFAIKTGLGWISFFTANSDEKKRAIHDHLSGSVVINVTK